MTRSETIAFRPLDRDNWKDLESLFGERGGSGGCWCMLWRRTRAEFEAGKGDDNRRALRRLARSGQSPGILAYAGDRPVGWCAIAPREDYPALARSRILKPVDEQAVWSVSCFFIDRAYRKQGLSVRLLEAAVDHAGTRGAKIVEGYPVEPREGKYPAVYAWIGLAKTFQHAGFSECARRSPTRPIMRRKVRRYHNDD